jgi:hypothetical protein
MSLELFKLPLKIIKKKEKEKKKEPLLNLVGPSNFILFFHVFFFVFNF